MSEKPSWQKYEIGDNISPYRKVIGKLHILVVESDDGSKKGILEVERGSEEFSYEDIIKYLNDCIEVQEKFIDNLNSMKNEISH